MIYEQNGFVSGDDPAGVPLIGWDTDIASVTASSEATGFPASNLLLPATHLKWKGSTSSSQTLTFAMAGATSNYLAIGKHNLFSTGAAIGLQSIVSPEAIAGTLKTLLHLDGADDSTEITDTSGNDYGWRCEGNAKLDTAQFKFGTSSAVFDGTDDKLAGIGSLFAFGTGAFTIDFWVRLNTTGAQKNLVDPRTAATSNAAVIYIKPTNVLAFFVNGSDRITGTTALTTGQWYHVAVTRTGTSTKLFLNGTQEGSTFSDSTSYIAATNAYIGAAFDGANGHNGWIDEFRLLVGTAAWTANFTAPTAAYSDGAETLVGGYALLLHLNGTDQSTTITDDGGRDHVFTAVNGAQIDTAQSKFGGASCVFDGTNDYLQGDGSDDFAFGSGDFTIDFWVRLNATGASQVYYDSRPIGAVDGAYVVIYKSNTDTLRLHVNSSSQITGTTAMTTGQWYHVAVTRSGTSTRLFLNGVQEGSTYSDSNVYLNAENRPTIGADSTPAGQPHNGWIDEMRVVRTALWTANFVVPPNHPANSFSLGQGSPVDDALPIIYRFTPTIGNLILTIGGGSAAAEMSVIYASELLVLERGVKVDVDHADLPHARKSSVVSGMSESGNFLGRVVLTEWREGKAEFEWFTPSWYRTNFEPFVEQAVTHPFFWAWNPDDYPEETALAWLVEDVRPETDPATRRMHATLSMRGIA